MSNKPYSKQIFAGTGQILTRLFLPLFRSVGASVPMGSGLPQATASFRLAMISELAWPTAAANAAHAYHLLLTGINKSLIWGNYENPTHYAIWFMFWHVAIIGLIAEKPSFPQLYGLFCSCRPSQSPSLLPCVWSSNCLKTSTGLLYDAAGLAWAVVRCTPEASLAIRNRHLAITRNLILTCLSRACTWNPPYCHP